MKILLFYLVIFIFPNSAKALTCISGFYLREGTETGVYCARKGSEICQEERACGTHEMYNPPTGQCQECSSIEYSCSLGSYNENRIIGWSSSSCSSVIKGCSYCNGKECTSCKSDYTLSNGQCIEKITCPANCSACSSSSVCTACGNGYTLSGGQCIEKIQSVESCPQDMKLSSDGCCCLNN